VGQGTCPSVPFLQSFAAGDTAQIIQIIISAGSGRIPQNRDEKWR